MLLNLDKILNDNDMISETVYNVKNIERINQQNGQFDIHVDNHIFFVYNPDINSIDDIISRINKAVEEEKIKYTPLYQAMYGS